jgi:DNA-binding protein YbaB
MVDPSTYDPDDDKSLQLVWMSAMNGVLSSTANNHSRIQRVINQAFTQSPYL